MKKMRIGKIAYTNILPVFYFVHEKLRDDHIEWIPQVPAQLNQQMKMGNIDLGPISAFAYAQSIDQYLLLPDLSVSALGPVGSIFLFSKVPINELEGKTIALTNTSATSVNLLRILLQKFYQVNAHYRTMLPNLTVMMEEADASLLIGDDALKASWNNPGYRVYDLGELWYRQTGKWMTFAVWAVNKSFADREEELLNHVFEVFQYSKKQSRNRLNELLQYTIQRHGGTIEFWRNYFSGLNHDLNKEQVEGLEYYFYCAYELGLLDHPVTVNLWNPSRPKLPGSFNT
ncbi:menaquinone biosynthesis protein [Microaerobacter geothermalis]|uniref:menaquinone biosynthetic enzyme MqnA/MqnD family protein n=1 Tax=Microaerobacter geothermalis TaxID=674972 RepID=UPI001F21F98B|nr:menaquinone biosynthesis protein [Microaerobacter geothermalis]MCF6095340.1 menaquinone biosynthesis protein [Microaerobacter geothermalis]